MNPSIFILAYLFQPPCWCPYSKVTKYSPCLRIFCLENFQGFFVFVFVFVFFLSDLNHTQVERHHLKEPRLSISFGFCFQMATSWSQDSCYTSKHHVLIPNKQQERKIRNERQQGCLLNSCQSRKQKLPRKPVLDVSAHIYQSEV